MNYFCALLDRRCSSIGQLLDLLEYRRARSPVHVDLLLLAIVDRKASQLFISMHRVQFSWCWFLKPVRIVFVKSGDAFCPFLSCKGNLEFDLEVQFLISLLVVDDVVASTLSKRHSFADGTLYLPFSYFKTVQYLSIYGIDIENM